MQHRQGQALIMIPSTQRAIVITAPGGPDVLIDSPGWPVPEIGPGEVLIEVAAAGINRHDCNQRTAGPSREPSPVPGLEASGRIIACGTDVPSSRLGEAVVALTDGGAYAQYVATDQGLALTLPKGLDWIAGAALPEALFTSWFNFVELMRMAPGERALIHGGTSGVGTTAIQMLSALGHDVFATAGTAEKRDAALKLGCRAVFDYTDLALAEKIRAATGGRGVDMILDTSAGAHIDQDIAALAPSGRIAFLSPGGCKELGVPLRALMTKRISITGALLRSTPLELKQRIAEGLRRQVWPLLGTSIRPVIDAVYPLSHAAVAHARMERNAHVGKIMLAVNRSMPA
jgi:putative PIG3 family NAD(P)H quinone oxidoreductase